MMSVTGLLLIILAVVATGNYVVFNMIQEEMEDINEQSKKH